MMAAGVFLLLLGILLRAGIISCENVETRIHALMTSQIAGVDFGRSLQESGGSLYASAPKLNITGGMYKCPHSYSATINRTVSCTEAVTFGTGNSSGGTSFEKVTTSDKKEYLVTCGNQYHFTCPKLQIQERMIGECYSYSVTEKTTSTIPSPCPVACPLGISADIVFVIDGSGSVGAPNFQKGLDWIVNVLRTFSYDINLGNIQIGFVPYDHALYPDIKSMKSGKFYDFRDEVMAIAYDGGGTNTPTAITKAAELLTASTTRPTVAKLMITMTDGQTQTQYGTPAEEALAAENKGITMIAVGIGSGINQVELNQIARSSSRVLNVNSYSELDSIIATLSKVIEETAKGSLEGGSSNSTTELTNCQFGSSIHASKTGLYIGAVGSYDRTGTVAEYDSITNFPNLRSSGHLNATEIADNLDGVNVTDLKESYFGYSVSSGKFTDDSPEWVVMSAPRYLLKGMVLIYRETPRQAFHQLHPNASSGHWQLGGYYGHSLLSIDIDNDKIDDLLVSSPLYTKTAGYDEGVVFVYMSRDNSPSKWARSDFSPVVLEGDSVRGARFGMNLVNGGDIDKNGINDVIVSAPTEGDTGSTTPSGAIYIYFASSTGLSNSRKQKIVGRTVSTNTQSLHGFGWSAYGGADFDGNGYTDVAISAPSSNSVVLLWSRKLITLTPTMTIMGNTSLDVQACAANPTRACSNMTVCLSARYEDGTDSTKTFELVYNVTLDSLSGAGKRLRFIDQTASIVSKTLSIGRTQTCTNYGMVLKTESLGKLSGGGGFAVTPRVELSVGLTEAHMRQVMSGVLSSSSQVQKTADWSFQKGCRGIGGRCEHDLKITILDSGKSSATPLLLTDESQKLKLSVSIENLGPDHAFFTRINVTSGNLTLNLINGSCVTSNDEDSDSSKGLTVIKFKSNRAGLNDMMLLGDKCDFTIEFDFAKMKSTATEATYNVKGVIYSNAGDESVAFDSEASNNRFATQGSVQYKSSATITELSIPESIYFNRTSTNTTVVKSLEDKAFVGNKTKLVHQYTLYNSGPLGLANSRVKLRWPEFTQSGLEFLYLIEVKCQPESACTCNTAGKANKFNLAPKQSSVGSFGNFTLKYPSAHQAFGSEKSVTCTNSICSEVYCDMAFIARFGNVRVLAEFKPWIPTFGLEFSKTQVFSTLDLIVSNVTSAQQDTTKTVLTELSTSPWFESLPNNGMKWWMILLAILGGLLLLIVVIVTMWKVGFFESKYKNMTLAGRQSVRDRGDGAGPSGEDDGAAGGPGTADPAMGQSTADLVSE